MLGASPPVAIESVLNFRSGPAKEDARMATPVSTKPGWRFGVFEVDTRRGELRRSGAPLSCASSLSRS